MVGSEGTLGFVSRVTYNTVPDLPFKASAFLIFHDIEEACDATSALKANTSVDAVEIFDRRSLTQCERMGELPKLCPEITRLPEDGEGAALLIECRGEDEAALKAAIDEVLIALRNSKVPVASQVGYNEEAFRHDPKEYNVFWDARKGLIPIVGGARETGTSMLLEDVACSTEKLGKMSKDLIAIFRKWGYHDACLMGHALEGNLHLIFNQVRGPSPSTFRLTRAPALLGPSKRKPLHLPPCSKPTSLRTPLADPHLPTIVELQDA
eukprot:scaffold162525_cov30-Tisochrysis_lutea.AAC.2